MKDFLDGVIVYIPSGKDVIVEFNAPEGKPIKRHITQKRLREISPGGKFRCGDGVRITPEGLQWRGHVTIKMSPEELEELDALYRKKMKEQSL